MIVFRNPGEIDLEAVRTLGVSVKLPGSFGRFGTGLKFAIATILRGGGSIEIYRGKELHDLGTVAVSVRGETFRKVTLDGESMGITTQLGRDWEPWMVLRELGCNALDEGGIFGLAHENATPLLPEEGFTTITVLWDELETAYAQRKDLFIEGEPLWKSEHLRILPGPSAHLFYRGVRVLQLPKPSLFTYDVLHELTLTEDRTLAGTWRVDGIIRDALLSMASKPLISQSITCGDGYHEHKLDFAESGYGVKPSRAFLDAAVEARESRKLTSESANKVRARHVRLSTEEASTFGSYRRVKDDAFGYAIEQLSALGIKFDDSKKFVFIDELPGEETLSVVEEGRVYILSSLIQRPAREIMAQLLARWVDINIDGYGADAVVRLLTPIIIGRAKDLKEDESLVREDEVLADHEPDVPVIETDPSEPLSF